MTQTSQLASSAVSTDLSDQLRKTSILSIAMIIGIHCSNVDFLGEETVSALPSWALWIQEWLSNWLFRIGTPTFMCISGYLFFWSFYPSLNSYKTKVGKRIRNLAIPFLTWSGLGIILFAALQSLPQTRSFFSAPYLSEMSWFELLGVWILDPLPYQLWFVRDLIVMCLLSPLLYHGLKSQLPPLLLLGGLVLWFFNLPELGVNNKTSFFYLLGAWFGIQKNNPGTPNFRRALESYTGILIAALAWLVLSVIGSAIRLKGGMVVEPIYKLQILCGMSAMWFSFRYWRRWLRFEWLNQVKTLTFFIYACHEPYTRIVCKGLLKVAPNSGVGVTFVYFATMIIIFAGCSVIGIFLKHRAPSVYALLSGWR
jgi:surface polysaccharide O-acyltransferase-like enzyme